MAGEDFKPKKNEFRIGVNTFYNRKNKIPMKILESKRSKIGIMVEFRGIPNGFPNLAVLIDEFRPSSIHVSYKIVVS